MDILLFSSGRANKQQKLLEYGKQELRRQIEENKIKNYLLVPYAVIGFSFKQIQAYLEETLYPMGVKVLNITEFNNPIDGIKAADAIAVSGGNTWYLNRCLHDYNLINCIRDAVLKNNKPYIGWSAGINIAAPTILTTNDMPIINAIITPSLNLVPFQINPHYTDSFIDGHMGETRDERIVEFLYKNQFQTVVGLREGSWLKLLNNKLSYYSIKGETLKIFNFNKPVLEVDSGDNIDFLLK